MAPETKPEHPKRVPGWEDNYEGYDYGSDVAGWLRDVRCMDDYNLPIKLSWQEAQEGSPARLELYRFCPRHGNPVILSVRGARKETFDRVARAIVTFYGTHAGEATVYRERRVGKKERREVGRIMELHWSLGRREWFDARFRPRRYAIPAAP